MSGTKIHKNIDYVSQNEVDDSKIYVHKNLNILFDSNLIEKSSPYKDRLDKNVSLENL